MILNKAKFPSRQPKREKTSGPEPKTVSTLRTQFSKNTFYSVRLTTIIIP